MGVKVSELERFGLKRKDGAVEYGIFRRRIHSPA